MDLVRPSTDGEAPVPKTKKAKAAKAAVAAEDDEPDDATATPAVEETADETDEEDEVEDDEASEGRRQVSRAEAEEYAKESGLLFFETSAKTGEGVVEVFTEIGEPAVGLFTQVWALTQSSCMHQQPRRSHWITSSLPPADLPVLAVQLDGPVLPKLAQRAST